MLVFSREHNIPILSGLANALATFRKDIIDWKPTTKPVFDMLTELKPEYLFVTQQSITDALKEAVPQYDTKLIMYGVHAPDEVKDRVALIIVPSHIPKKIVDNITLPHIQLKAGADIVKWRGGHHVDRMTTDVLYLSNSNSLSRPYIAYHLNVLRHTPYRVCVVGTRLPTPQYVGSVTAEDAMNFIKSSSITLDYDWDMALDIMINKSFCLSNVKNDLVPFFNNDIELVSLVDKFANDKKARNRVIKQSYAHLIEHDTYFHRLSSIAEILGEKTWMDEANKNLKRYIA